MAIYNGHNEDSNGNILLNVGSGITATIETSDTASQSYSKGSYLFYHNTLCKVTTSITSGATLSIGINLAYTNVGSELNSHLRASNGNEFYFDYKDGVPGFYPNSSKVSSEFIPFTT